MGKVSAALDEIWDKILIQICSEVGTDLAAASRGSAQCVDIVLIHLVLKKVPENITHMDIHIHEKQTQQDAPHASLWSFRYWISRQNLRSACSREHMALPLIYLSLEHFHSHRDALWDEYRKHQWFLGSHRVLYPVSLCLGTRDSYSFNNIQPGISKRIHLSEVIKI